MEDWFSTRQKTAAITEVAGSSCAGCHSNVVNPMGFPFEKFGPLGETRETEAVYYPIEHDNADEVLTYAPVDSAVKMNILGQNNRDIADGVELSAVIGRVSIWPRLFCATVLSIFSRKSGSHFEGWMPATRYVF